LRASRICGEVAEWSKALAWKVSIGQKLIAGSNPALSAISPFQAFPSLPIFLLLLTVRLVSGSHRLVAILTPSR
jgi:hypothetical protein